jgi:SEC-C motif-containing protein
MREGAKSALELMKSRYSAYCVADLGYIESTTTPNKLDKQDIAFLTNWSKNSTWQHLEIVDNSEDTNSGMVEFKAYYIYEKVQRCHHEKSTFVKIDDVWYYDEGELFEENFRIGRNDECICGSGKKYKKCCNKLID